MCPRVRRVVLTMRRAFAAALRSLTVTHHALKVAKRVMHYAPGDPVGYPSRPLRMWDSYASL
jgi:hypothetical protein